MHKVTFPYLKTFVLVFGVLLLATNVALAQVSVSTPTLSSRVGVTQSINVNVVTLPAALSVLSYQFDMAYDSTILRITGYTTIGTISATAKFPVVNFTTPGVVHVAVANDSALFGSGALITFTASITGTGTSPLTLSNFKFNEGYPSASVTSGQLAVPSFSVSLPSASTDTLKGTGNIPIKADALTGKGIQSYQFTISYDTTYLSITGIDVTGTTSANMTVLPNASVAGKITVAAASTDTAALTGANGATLINLVASVKKAAGSAGVQTALTFSSYQFNEGNPVAGWVDGTIWAKSTVDVPPINLPLQYALDQNYPNPFNPTTMITFGLPRQSTVTLEVYNILGMKVRTLIAGERMNAAKYSYVWDGKDDAGMSVSSGVYLYRIQTEGFSAAKKMVLMK